MHHCPSIQSDSGSQTMRCGGARQQQQCRQASRQATLSGREERLALEVPDHHGCVQVHAVLHGAHAPLCALHLLHGHRAALQLLVVLEEPADLRQPVGGQLRQVTVVLELGVVDADGHHLVVLVPLVQDTHDADGLGADHRHGGHRHLCHNQDLNGLAILLHGAGNEAEVVGVHGGRHEHLVHLQETALLVELVLHLAVLGDGDHGVDHCGRIGADMQVMPDVGRAVTIQNDSHVDVC
mmetsp:Transcript_9662/g.20041  ORF Transcript_9662/g.20041 Transcript_9662/m.20041 type:complete len:238 (-) Transcript_9662:42-755(-)